MEQPYNDPTKFPIKHKAHHVIRDETYKKRYAEMVHKMSLAEIEVGIQFKPEIDEAENAIRTIREEQNKECDNLVRNMDELKKRYMDMMAYYDGITKMLRDKLSVIEKRKKQAVDRSIENVRNHYPDLNGAALYSSVAWEKTKIGRMTLGKAIEDMKIGKAA